MKIAFIILAYKNPFQLRSLVECLQHPDHHFYIHVDQTKTIEPFLEELRLLHGANIEFLPRINSYWGSYQTVKALIAGLKSAYHSATAFDYFIHLSGQDFPVSSVDHIREKLMAAAPASFLYHFKLPALNWNNGGLDRIEACQFFLGTKRVVLQKKAKNLISRLLYPCWNFFRKRFDTGKDFYGGEFYFIFHRTATTLFFDNLEKYSGLAMRLKYTLIPEEIYLPTILMQSNVLKIQLVNDTLRYINWEEQSRSPKTLQEEDIARIKPDTYLFARKLDFNQPSPILDQLKRLIQHPESQNTPIHS